MYPFLWSMRNIWLLVNYDEKSQDIAKWIANIFMYVSAIVLSISIPAAQTLLPYVAFFISHVLWSFFAWKIRDVALLYQFLFFIPIDIYAMYIRF